LKEKLGLFNSDTLSARYFHRLTRNVNYILDVNGNPKYFMKLEAEGHKKEREVYNFLSKNAVVNTLLPIYSNEKLMIFPFMQNFKDGDVRNHLEFISEFHNNSLRLKKQLLENNFNKEEFSNHYLKRFVVRIERHREMVENFWKDSKELEEYYLFKEKEDYEELPKILVHGDIQHKNLQIGEDGKSYLIDFEDSYYDAPSWDLTRPLMDLNYDEMDPFVEEYIKRSLVKDKKTLKKRVYRDLVVRVVTDAIGRQQRFEKRQADEYIKMYKERYLKKLREIIDNGN